MIRLEIKNWNMILTEKQQKYQHSHPQKNDKYEFLTGEEILPPDQRGVTEQAKFAYSVLGKAFEKQAKMIEEQGKALTEEELESIEGIFEKM